TTKAGNNLVSVTGTQAGTVDTTVDAGAADVRFGSAGKLDDIQGAVTVTRATPGGVITLDDSAQTNTPVIIPGPLGPIVISVGKTYDLGANSVERAGMAKITFDDNTSEVRVLAGTGIDQFNVNAMRGGSATYDLDGGSGTDTLTGPNQSNLWEVLAPD